MHLINLLDLIGTSVFAISGALAASSKEMDLSGILAVGFIVGNGGGTIRDLLLNRTVFWLHDPNILYISILPSIVILLLSRFFYFSERLLLIPDAIGLGVFAVVGAQITLNMGMRVDIAVIMGVITAAGGGMLRDILCGEVPLILKREIYATAAFCGSLLYVLLIHHINRHTAGLIAILLVLIIRMVAIKLRLGLPKFSGAWFVKRREHE